MRADPTLNQCSENDCSTLAVTRDRCYKHAFPTGPTPVRVGPTATSAELAADPRYRVDLAGRDRHEHRRGAA